MSEEPETRTSPPAEKDNSDVAGSTDPTEFNTTRPSPANKVSTLSDRLQHLSVSPPRRRDSTPVKTRSPSTVPTTTTSSSSPAMRSSTPPPNTVPPRSKPATPVDPSGPLGLPRNRSSPSLLDASPKSASGGSGFGSTGPPPPRSSSRRSPRQTSPAVHPVAARAHHELTPITRNTSEAGQFVDEEKPPPHGVVVSPEEKLHGEHLALPTGDDYSLPHQFGLQQPPLPQRRMSNEKNSDEGGGGGAPPYLPVASRPRSLGTMDMQKLAQTAREQHRLAMSNYSWDSSISKDDEEQVDEIQGHQVGEPVQFPSRKIYSFTSGQQYKAAVEEERGTFLEESSPQHHQLQEQNIWTAASGLKPYQPSRNDLGDVGLPREETSRIFISRHSRSNGSSSEEGSRGNSNLRGTVPLEERQWSIPSIRMANHVHGSTTSYTDEEDDLFRGYDDDASLSSRGSSLYLPEEGVGGVSTGEAAATSLRLGPGVSTAPPASFHHSAPVVIEDGMDRVFHIDNVPDASAVAVAPPAQPQQQQDVADNAPRPERRKKKRTKKHNDKERQAYEWLRTVELGPENNVFCEAASSKFLTGSKAPTTSLPPNPPLNRTDSSPATVSRSSRH